MEQWIWHSAQQGDSLKRTFLHQAKNDPSLSLQRKPIRPAVSYSEQFTYQKMLGFNHRESSATAFLFPFFFSSLFDHNAGDSRSGISTSPSLLMMVKMRSDACPGKCTHMCNIVEKKSPEKGSARDVVCHSSQ